MAGVSVDGDFALDELRVRLDVSALFTRRWKIAGRLSSQRDDMAAREELARVWQELVRTGVLEPKAVSGLFRVQVDGESFRIREPGSGESVELVFRRADTLRTAAEPDIIGLQLVTLGKGVADHAADLGRVGRVREQFLWHGLAAELTEAQAVLCEERLRAKAGWSSSRRVSPGYPAWPDLAEQEKLFRLLEPGRVGVSLTETMQLVPEYSTSAAVLSGGD